MDNILVVISPFLLIEVISKLTKSFCIDFYTTFDIFFIQTFFFFLLSREGFCFESDGEIYLSYIYMVRKAELENLTHTWHIEDKGDKKKTQQVNYRMNLCQWMTELGIGRKRKNVSKSYKGEDGMARFIFEMICQILVGYEIMYKCKVHEPMSLNASVIALCHRVISLLLIQF